jgi:hypothetical protein
LLFHNCFFTYLQDPNQDDALPEPADPDPQPASKSSEDNDPPFVSNFNRGNPNKRERPPIFGEFAKALNQPIVEDSQPPSINSSQPTHPALMLPSDSPYRADSDEHHNRTAKRRRSVDRGSNTSRRNKRNRPDHDLPLFKQRGRGLSFEDCFENYSIPYTISEIGKTFRNESASQRIYDVEAGYAFLYCNQVLQTAKLSTVMMNVDGTDPLPKSFKVEWKQPTKVQTIQACDYANMFTDHRWHEYLAKFIGRFDLPKMKAASNVVILIAGGQRTFMTEIAGKHTKYFDIASDFADDLDFLSTSLEVPVLYLGMPNPSDNPKHHSSKFTYEISRALRSKARTGKVAIRDVFGISADIKCTRGEPHFEELGGYRDRFLLPNLGRVIHQIMFYAQIDGFSDPDYFP